MPSLPLRILVTLTLVLLAVLAGQWIWNYYLYSPWTRDGRISAQVITLAPEVSGRVAQLAVSNNQKVSEGELLFSVEPARYQAALGKAEAMVARQQSLLALAENRHRQQQQARRQGRIGEADLEQAAIQVQQAEAELALAQTQLDQAQLDLENTRIHAPRDGTIVNLGLQAGNPLTQGKPVLSLVVADSFYVTGYFEETKLPLVKLGQRATVTLMNGGYQFHGHVDSIGPAIANTNMRSNEQLLPQVQQNFNWVRLAQRIPVIIRLDQQPENIPLAAGMTVSVRLDPVQKDAEQRAPTQQDHD